MEFMEKLIIDYLIIRLLKQGFNQQEISDHFKANNIRPSSLSSVEKRLNQIKAYYEARTLYHLACIIENKF